MTSRKTAKAKPQPKKTVDDAQPAIAATALPRRTLEQSIAVALKLHEVYAGKSASIDELASALTLSKSNNNFKYLVWSATAYGLIKADTDQGAKLYSLAETGRKIVAETFPGEAQEAKVKAVLTPTLLSQFFTDYNNHAIPGEAHIENVLETRYKVPRERAAEAKDLIVTNGFFAGILTDQEGGQPPSVQLVGVPSGSEAIDLEGLPSTDKSSLPKNPTRKKVEQSEAAINWQKTCFYITPLGEEGSEERRHADMMLKHLLKPVFESEELDFKVVRADEIAKTGLITSQILSYLAHSRICVADMSFRNPNAFYELGVRHAFLLATIQIIHKTDKIPFDVSQGRTITIDTSDRYTVTDRLDSARNELREYVTSLLQDDGAEINPVAVYLPGVKVTIPS